MKKTLASRAIALALDLATSLAGTLAAGTLRGYVAAFNADDEELYTNAVPNAAAALTVNEQLDVCYSFGAGENRLVFAGTNSGVRVKGMFRPEGKRSSRCGRCRKRRSLPRSSRAESWRMPKTSRPRSA